MRYMFRAARAKVPFPIVALVGLKDVRTGHTLADPKAPATLEPMVFPDPVISIAVNTKDKANSEKLGTALGKMVAEESGNNIPRPAKLPGD